MYERTYMYKQITFTIQHVHVHALHTSTHICTHTHTHIHTHTQIFCAECAGYVANLKYLDNKPGRVCHTCCIKLKGGEDYSKGSVAWDPCPVNITPYGFPPPASFSLALPSLISLLITSPNRCLLTRIFNRFSAQTQEEVVREADDHASRAD